MKNKFFHPFVLISAIFSLCLLGCIFPKPSQNIDNSQKTYDKILKIHFINVGQGDSILLQFNNKNMLIDAGPEDSSHIVVNYLKSAGITNLNYVLATHPHEDHIGGMPSVIKNFDIGSFYAPKKQTDTKIFQSMIENLQKKKLKINIAKAGINIDMDPELNMTVIAPNASNYDNLNDYSAAVRVTYKDTAFLFMGDAEKLSEEEILRNNFNVKADLLKLSHHGSSSSSCDRFLDAVNPKYAVASVGNDNNYGHPSKEILESLQKRNIKLYRTDQSGTIVVYSDGSNISFK